MKKPKTMAQGAPALDPETFWRIEEPGPEERLALQLSRQFQDEEEPGCPSVSWACQERAIKTVNELGFVKALQLLKIKEDEE